jgi:hypothetical protein
MVFKLAIVPKFDMAHKKMMCAPVGRITSRDETKIKNQSKQNKYADPGYRRMMYNCMGHT